MKKMIMLLILGLVLISGCGSDLQRFDSCNLRNNELLVEPKGKEIYVYFHDEYLNKTNHYEFGDNFLILLISKAFTCPSECELYYKKIPYLEFEENLGYKKENHTCFCCFKKNMEIYKK